ncbi:MAG TPA: hypothetical protein VNZ52_06445 [Candidatus Thermoplasmatota archaeon]|nr:hypothetical protein [Candidatus Thermoplasmatota archaeon]
MLERVAEVGTRQKAAVTAAGLCALLLLLDVQFATDRGQITLRFLAPFFAAHFAVRYLALRLWGVRRGTLAPRLGARAASWALIVVPLYLTGVFQYTPFGIPFAALVVIDHLMVFLARDTAPEDDTPRNPISLAAPLKILLGILLLGGAVLFHFYVAAPLAYGRLLEWTAAAFVACIVLWRGLVRGPKAPERLPLRYSLHKPKAEPIPDPLSAPFERAVRAFLQDGDSQPLVKAAEDVGRASGLSGPALQDLRERVLRALARSGTRREDDLRSAMQALEQALNESVTLTPPVR